VVVLDEVTKVVATLVVLVALAVVVVLVEIFLVVVVFVLWAETPSASAHKTAIENFIFA